LENKRNPAAAFAVVKLNPVVFEVLHVTREVWSE
jgi:hypothetical protein